MSEATTRPTEVIMAALAAKADGRDFDEERLREAVLIMSAATLLAKGLDPDLSIEVIESALAHGDIRVALEDGELVVTMGEGIEAGPGEDPVAEHGDPDGDGDEDPDHDDDVDYPEETP